MAIQTRVNVTNLLRTIIAISACYLAGSVSANEVNSSQTNQKHTAKETVTKTIKIALSQQAERRSFAAKIEAIKAATVSAQTSGRILKVYYDMNDLVEIGAPLLEITNKEQGAGLSSAEADLAKAQAIDNEAQAQFKRFKELFPQGAISKGAMDEATSRAKSSKQAVTAAKAMLVKATETLNYTVVSAPFSGRVTQRFVEQGETISYGQPLFSGYDTQQLRAVFYIPQSEIQQFQSTSQVDIVVNNQTLSSANISISQFADPQTHSHLVRVNLDQANTNGSALNVGQWVKAVISQPAAPTLVLPLSAIHQMNDLSGAFRKSADKFVLNQIRLGRINYNDQTVEVLSGLTAGDEVIVDAGQYLAHSNSSTVAE